MQLYSLVDPKGREARAAFDYATGNWIEDHPAGKDGLDHAARVQGWAKQYGLDLNIEHREVVGRIALHCPAASCYWHPEGQQLNYYLEHVQHLKAIIENRNGLRSALRQSTRELDAATIRLLLDELEEHFRDYDVRDQHIVNSLPIAREALDRLVKP